VHWRWVVSPPVYPSARGKVLVMKTLIVSNFPDETTEEDVRNLFQEYQVEKVTLRPNKYAVVTFRNEAAAVRALDEWREVVWSRHWLRVKPGRW
jgi:RNA recognition motif-containing protein